MSECVFGSSEGFRSKELGLVLGLSLWVVDLDPEGTNPWGIYRYQGLGHLAK